MKMSGLMVSLACLYLASLVNAQVPGDLDVNVTTWQNDNLRTGQNIKEIALTPSAVKAGVGSFGQLCSVQLTGQVYAQPLIVTDVTIGGHQYTGGVAYVVTQADILYAIDATNCHIINTGGLSLLNGGHPADCTYLGQPQLACTNVIGPFVGILGTPVINFSGNTGTIYIVTETQDVSSGPPGNWYHYLHAVDIKMLTENVPPVRIFSPYYLSNPSGFSEFHIQRPGLLYANGYVYVGFSMMDGNYPLPNGSIFAFDPTTLAQKGYFATTPDGANEGGGVWQGGAGLAYGPETNGAESIFFNTGNGLFNVATGYYGDSFMKLNPTPNAQGLLTVTDYFTPVDQYYRSCHSPFYTDLDFGSGGPMLTPSTANWPNIAVSGEKSGGVWTMDRTAPGEFTDNSACDVCPANGHQNLDCTTSVNSNNKQTFFVVSGSNNGPVIHTSPAYWNNSIYLAPQEGTLAQYKICSSTSSVPFCNNSSVSGVDLSGTPVTFTEGATPAVSANNTSGGIVWAILADDSAQGTTNGVLWAFNASTMKGLYNSANTLCNDAIAPATKFSVPAVANGYVYVGTRAQPTVNNGNAGMFYIFGLNAPCT